MVVTRQLLATIPHDPISAIAALPAFKLIGFGLSVTFASIAKGKHVARGARTRALSFAVATLICLSFGSSADGASKGRRMSAESAMAVCNDSAVTARIAAEASARHWGAIVRFVDVRDIPNPAKWPPYMRRQFCQAVVTAEGDVGWPVYYAIFQDALNHGRIEWCVLGLDREWAYDPRCRLARP